MDPAFAFGGRVLSVLDQIAIDCYSCFSVFEPIGTCVVRLDDNFSVLIGVADLAVSLYTEQIRGKKRFIVLLLN